MNFLSPTRRKLTGWRRPLNIWDWQLDKSDQLTRDMAFYIVPNRNNAFDMFNDVPIRPPDRPPWNPYSRGTKYGECSYKSSYEYSHFDHRFSGTATTGSPGIWTSDGAGTGAFTLLQIANPAASATRNFMLGNRYAPSYAMICANMDNTGSGLSGSFALSITPTVQAAHVTGVVDGEFHAFAGRRHANFTKDVWVDGTQRNSVAGTSQDVVPSGIVYLYVGGIEVGSLGSDNDILISMGWNRALTDEEMVRISRDPWSVLSPRRARTSSLMGLIGGAAAGGGPYIPLIRRRRR